ncbi:MAG: hypothetical protein HZA16_15330 [Nitrospirae bacterium]|nr:hypothetical protein [Nitrospirota bacterium]
MNIIAYITVNFLLFAAWHVFLFRHRAVLSFAGRLAGAFVLGLTQITVTEMLLGVVLKQLYAGPLFFLNATVSALVLIGSARAVNRQRAVTDGSGARTNILEEISGTVAWLVSEIRNSLTLLAVSVLFILSVCWIMFLGYLFPSYSWDGLWYHLPIVGHIMQSGAVREISNNSFIEQFINIFPKNIELFFLWNIIFLQSDVIADLSQLPFVFAGIISIYGLAVRLGVGSRHAIYAALLFFFTPVVILQASTNYVDVAVAALFFAAVNFLMAEDVAFSPPFGKGGQGGLLERTEVVARLHHKNITTMLAGLATGLLLGSKGSGPLFTGILSAVFIVREFRRGLTSSALAYFFIPVFLTGGYWYVKNWLVYGNPVYPMEISFFNITLFKGLYQGIIEPAPEIINNLHPVTRPLYVWLEKVEYYLYDSRLGGLGPLWFILFLPCMVFSIIHSFVKRNYRFLAVFIIMTSAFLMHPRNWNPRYVIFIAGLGALSFGLALNYFLPERKMLRLIALALATYTVFVSNSPCITPKQIIQFMHLPPSERTIANHAPFNIDLHARQEYGHWTWINRNLQSGETLGYSFEPLFLAPLWNSSYSSRIAYAKSDTYNEWLKKLTDEKVTYVLVRRNSGEDKWIQGEPEKFKAVFSDENYRIAKKESGK